MTLAKRVFPTFTRYSESKARSVRDSTLGVQIGDTPNDVVSHINRGLQLGTSCFNRTLVRKTRLRPIRRSFLRKAVSPAESQIVLGKSLAKLEAEFRFHCFELICRAVSDDLRRAHCKVVACCCFLLTLSSRLSNDKPNRG